MSELIKLAYGLAVRAQNDNERSIEVVASSAAIDGYDEIVVQDWDLKRYEANPVVLYGHNSWGMPIGHASDVRVEKGKLLATLHFVDARANPQAEQVWQGIVQGSLRAVSVGFRSRSVKSTEVDGKTIFMLGNNELLEISVVPIPANPEAVAIAAKSMDIIRALAGASTNKTGDAPTQEKKTMSTASTVSFLTTICALVGLTAAATEHEAIDKVKSLDRKATDADARATSAESSAKAIEAKVLEATGTDSFEKALGAIAAGKTAIASVVESSKKVDELERAKVIADAKAEKKLSPAQEKELEGKSLDFVKEFVRLQHPNPALVGNDSKEAPVDSTTLKHNGKSWSELKPSEKHALYHENKALYEAMRDGAEKAAA